MARGSDRCPIFGTDEADQTSFCELLALAVARYELVAHSYCLMGNHYHLLIETRRANLPLAMRHLNGRYAQSFNQTHRRSGQWSAPLSWTRSG